MTDEISKIIDMLAFDLKRKKKKKKNIIVNINPLLTIKIHFTGKTTER